uniref:phosphate ABC transporter substrate-binding protein n=1 Tax=Halomonas sp. DP5Y7-2 TaxID=2859076 RepID=UPI0021BD744E|nr:phosphate ABC transporter substrate-binding protein [Halomonas sp. DP5Y7-2]
MSSVSHFAATSRRIAMLLWLGWVAWLPLPATAHDVAGALNAVGSDTMAELMLRWGEQFEEQRPGVRLQLQVAGSASAPPALIAGTTLLGPMSRPMQDDEKAAFAARHGYAITPVVVGKDALVVVVNRHNPLERLNRQQLDAIFSDTLACGAEESIDHWQQLGLDDPQGSIHLYGRNAVSGTHGLFRRRALCDGEFKVSVTVSAGSAAVVAAVGDDPRGIGYVGLNHLNADVREVAIADGQRDVRPERQALRDGDYPLVRDLLIYVNRPPETPLPEVERAFLDMVLSPSGQRVVKELGFVALSPSALMAQRRALGLPALAREER